MNRMNLLITGGAGFCGLNIAEHALVQGANVVAYGLESPMPAALRAFADLPGRFAFHQGNVCDRSQVADAIRQHGITHIVHGAAITAALEREAVQARDILQVNTLGTIEVLEAAAAAGIRRMVHLSSGSVFGARVPDTDALDEAESVPLPDSLYGISKFAAERTAMRYRATRELDVVVARLGVVFGRWEHDTGLRDTLSIPLQLSELAEQGVPARLNPTLPDDWVYASDVAAAIGSILRAPAEGLQSLYQIGSGTRWSALDWCARLKQRFPHFDYQSATRAEDINVGVRTPTPRPIFSIRRLHDDLGYEPRFDPATAFEDYMDWRRVDRSG